MAPECQQKNAKGLTMVAIGMNKGGEEFLILDEATRQDLASGKYRDQRRSSFGTSVAAPPAAAPAAGTTRPDRTADHSGTTRRPAPGSRRQPAQRRPLPNPPRPWTPKQERLALLYNEQGLRPGEIAEKLGVSSYLVTQIILAAKNRGKL
jgi:hypothetical protein